MSRPRTLFDGTEVALRATGETTLQKASDRRAVVDLLVNNGGKMEIRQINKHFGFDISAVIRALLRTGWLEVVE